MHVLILDDEERIGSFLADLAELAGWTSQAVQNKDTFRSHLFRQMPDVVMLDLHLGGTDGISEMRFLAQCQFRGPIVLMSGFDQRVLASARQIGSSLGLNIVDILEKPIRAATARELLKSIEQVSAHRPVVEAVGARKAQAKDLTAADIDGAVQRGEMELYYQPIVSVASREVSHAEALIRWNHPNFGLVFPGAFIAMAEKNPKTIDLLTDWVIKAAAGHIRALNLMRIPIRVAVNVSGANLRSIEYPDHLAGLIDSVIDPASLIIEVTESVATHNSSAADILTRLRLKGFALSIDDFGTGYSSLEALRRIPFTNIKVDQTFVADLGSSKDSLAIVNSVIALARSMNLSIIAEGVESLEIANQLGDLGVDYLQGYYFSRPIPFKELVPWIQKFPARQADKVG